jgi:hypothetical protein
MTRFLLALSGALILGSIGAFFLFVPPVWIAAVSIATVALLLIAFMGMFWLGVKAELEPMLPVAIAGEPLSQLAQDVLALEGVGKPT